MTRAQLLFILGLSACDGGGVLAPPAEPPLCTPGATRCVDGHPHTCSADGAAETRTSSCQAAEHCANGVCTADVCPRGERFCDGGIPGAVYACSATGESSTLVTACDASEHCAAGACAPGVCAPGAAFCDAGDAFRCNADGSAATLLDDCAADEFCYDGSCTADVCAQGTSYCVGGESGEPYSCNADGSGQTQTAVCASAEFCEAGACVSDVCAQGTDSCDAGDAYRCNATGSSVTLLDDCGAAELCAAGVCACDPASGICQNGDGCCASACTYSIDDDCPPPVAPLLAAFTAAPPRVAIDVPTSVAWSWTFANTPEPDATCSIDNGVGPVSNGGSTSVRIATDTAYILRCDNAAGSDTLGLTLSAVEPTDVVAFGTGNRHGCALLSDGSVWCWGRNLYGELGDGLTASRSTPAQVSGLDSGVTALSVGTYHNCALMNDGSIRCWGYNDGGQLGDGTTTDQRTPVNVLLADAALAVAAGGGQTCALVAGGTLYCWGSNRGGQLGDGSTVDRPAPTAITLPAAAETIAAGTRQTCATVTGGAAYCWGYNGEGQVGNGTIIDQTTPAPVTSLDSGVVSLTLGAYHTCARLSDGTARCWGYNGDGRLGDNSTINRPTPVAVAGAAGVTSIGAGMSHTCAVLAGGAVRCWGYNYYGQLGDGTTTSRFTPNAVSGLADGAVAVDAGAEHSCALLNTGRMRCWGSRAHGQIGDGIFDAQTTAVPVTPLAGMSTVAAGAFHSCGILADGSVRCWGRASQGQLGHGSTAASDGPATVAGLPARASQITVGFSHSCAVLENGHAYCWGNNLWGKLGDGSTAERSAPVRVGTLTGVTSIAAGWSHTCAVVSGAAMCWGYNFTRQLGDGTGNNRVTPGNVSGLASGVAAIVAGHDHSCALDSAGGVLCWGANTYNQLGDARGAQRATPVAVSGLSSGVASITAGDYHTCARLSDGSARCWGRGLDGRLGDGAAANRNTPTQVSGLTSGVASIAAGGSHTCATLTDDSVRCWGLNGSGQLGTADSISSPLPTPLAAPAPAASTVAAGGNHTCLVRTDGVPLCFGNDADAAVSAGPRGFPREVLLLGTP